MNNSTANNRPVTIPPAGKLEQHQQPNVKPSNFVSFSSNSIAQGWCPLAPRHPLAVVASGVARSLISVLGATAKSAFEGQIGFPGYALLGVGLGLLAYGARTYNMGSSSLEIILEGSIEHAFKEMPKRIRREMSKFPAITPELAKRYNTTVAQLQTDQCQAAKMLCVHTVLDSVKSAADQHWDRHGRKLCKSAIDDCAKKLILKKVNHLQHEKNLEQFLWEVYQPAVPPQSTYGVSQREYFALNRIAEYLISECLAPAATPARDDSEVIASCSGAERKDAYIKTCEVMADAIEALYLAFDQFVRATGAGPDMGLVSAIDQQFNMLRPHQTTTLLDQDHEQASPSLAAAKKWLLEQKANFSSRVNDVFNRLPADSQAAFRNVMLNAHLQQAGNLATAWVQDLAAFSGARQKLEQIRREASKGEVLDVKSLKGWMKIGLKGVIEIVGQKNSNFSDLREAMDDNRSGTPWKDTRLHEHTENLTRPMTMIKVRPEHRAATLDVLAAYGEKIVGLFGLYGLRIVSGEKNAGLTETKRSGCTREAGQLEESQIEENKILSPRYDSSLNQKMGVEDQINFKDYAELQTISHFSLNKKSVLIDDYSTRDGRGTMAHELGHVLDAALVAQDNTGGLSRKDFFSERSPSLRTEYKKAVKCDKGITVYSQANELEFFAESAAAYLEMPYTFDRTYTTPVSSIKSRDNLWAQHPVMAQFLDEILRAPTQLVRAANTQLGADDKEKLE